MKRNKVEERPKAASSSKKDNQPNEKKKPNKMEERLKAIQEPITDLISKARKGDSYARDRLWNAILPILKEKAEADLRGNNIAGVMRPSDLLQGAFVRLLEREKVGWNDRIHLYAFAARVMRHIIIDHRRRFFPANRTMVSVEELLGVTSHDDVSLVEMAEILEQLEAIDPKHAEIADLRFFGGLTNEEIGEVMGISLATVKRRLTFPRAFIMSRISKEKDAKKCDPA